MDDIVTVETIKFNRPSSDKVEVGLRISNDAGRAIIIDKDLNPIVNASYRGYLGDAINYTLDF